MSEQRDQPVERGAAEENFGAPLTETEEEVSRRPPSEPAEREQTGGTSGQPDAGRH
jgi:hypothetical protein